MSAERNRHIGAIVGVVENGLSVAEVLLPQYRAYLLMGAAVAKQLPELYADVVRLISKEAPTDQERAELARKLRALANPEESPEPRA